MDFVAIDVETANAALESICQIGVACYSNGRPIEEWATYVDPGDYFDEINVSIHGIDEETVAGAPNFEEIAETLYGFLENRIVVCHTHFDRVAIHEAAERYMLEPPVCTWLDSARVARRAWKEFASSGYGCQNVCQSLGYEYDAHDALEDAKAAGHIIIEAIKQSGRPIEGWLARVKRPITSPTRLPAITQDGDKEGPLYGEVMVFTGALELLRYECDRNPEPAGTLPGKGHPQICPVFHLQRIWRR